MPKKKKKKYILIECCKCGRKHKHIGGVRTVILVMCHVDYYKRGVGVFDRVEFPIMCKDCIASFAKWWRNRSTGRDKG